MSTQPRTTDSEHARLQNDYGADYWVRNSVQEHRVRTHYHHPLSQYTISIHD
jgi:hypothetical protein